LKPSSGRLLFVFGELGAGPAGSETSNRPGRRGRVNGSGGPWASGRVALDRGAEVRPCGNGAGETPVGSPPTCARGPRSTGAAAGPRQHLPARPARRSGSPVGSLATGPVRGERREAVLAQRGEVDREIDAAEGPPAEVNTPVGHEPQGRRAAGRNICSARELAWDRLRAKDRELLIARGARSCGQRAPLRPARSLGPRSTRGRPRSRRQPACRSRAPQAARCA